MPVPTARRTSFAHRRRIAGSAVALAATLGMAGPALAAPEPSDSSQPTAVAAPIEAAVSAQVTGGRQATFWVELDSQADLTGADGSAAAVYEAKTGHAERTQARLRALLAERGVEFEPFWVHNTIKVTGDANLVAELAAQSEVARIEADEVIELPAPQPASTGPSPSAVEWNVEMINAPAVWDLGVRGEGIVIANIDTGVQFDHPALAGSYRGASEDGTFDHDYNWFDPAGICPHGTPCDNNSHGTHTMGTMVGTASGNQIGVAPGARWIAAKGCESSTCSRASLMAAGQWIIAPTDRQGGNPRPDLAPDVVNNSWGTEIFDPWYLSTVQAWIAAGTFPVFSAGNTGPSCDTIGSPGDHVETYTVGSIDANGVVAGNSSRGSDQLGHLKPNIAAPGVGVRSAVPGGYGMKSGTSMAAPHVAATVALMWSHSPVLYRDVAATRAALDRTAVDLADLSCGGTAERNYVAGEGRLDAYAAVTANPRGYAGHVAGQVTSTGTGAPVAGARVVATGQQTRETFTGADGRYRLNPLIEGEYTVTVSAFGHEGATSTVTVLRDSTVTSDHQLVRLPHATITGTVLADHGQAPGTVVRATGTPVSATADATGAFRLSLPHGSYELVAEHPANSCLSPASRQLELGADTSIELMLANRVDGYGYSCRHSGGDWVAGTDWIEPGASVALPFPVALYGRTYRNASLLPTGMITFVNPPLGSGARNNRALPTSGVPNAALYPMWDYWWITPLSGMYTATLGTAPNRTFVVEWRNMRNDASPTEWATFAVLIGENGTFTYRYGARTGDTGAAGAGATIGLENADSTAAFQYSLDQPVVRPGMSITFAATGHGMARGTVTDGNDTLPLEGSTVTLRRDGATVAADTTVADGAFTVQAPAGDYELAFTADHYQGSTVPVTVEAGRVVERGSSLGTARVTATDTDWVVPAGESRQRSMSLGNTGTLGSDFTVAEATDVPWLAVTAGSGGRLEPGRQLPVSLALDAAGLAPGTVHRAELVVTSDSGRASRLTVPVTLVVPRYQFAIDAGGAGGAVDSLGDSWVADRKHQPGSFGYVEARRSSTRSATVPIAGTNDPARYQTQRDGMYGYRFDGLTPGTYTIELEFAELTDLRPGERIFDVVAETTQILPNLDLARQVGVRTALRRTATVRVTDGALDLRFIEQRGDGTPIVSAVRVTHRPDLP